MSKIQNSLSRFLYRHPNFGIPRLMLVIVAGTVLVWLLDMFGGNGTSFSSLLAFSPYYILHGQVWRIITFIFIPSTTSFWLVVMLYFYYFIGSALEREWGAGKFTVYYGMGVLINVLVGFLVYFLFMPGVPAATASMEYVNLSLFFAFATLYPEMKVLLFFIIPIKVKWMAWVSAAMFALSIIMNFYSMFAENIYYVVGVFAPIVGILNYLIFFWGDIRGFFKKAKRQTSKQTVNFKKATQQVQQQRGFIHKCAVCGKTDAEFPTMNFRYCSKCNGYYCYCEDHINNHSHIE